MAGKQRGRKSTNPDSWDVATVIAEKFGGNVEAYIADQTQRARNAQFMQVAENDPAFKRVPELLDMEVATEEQLSLISEVVDDFEAVEARLLEQLEQLREKRDVLSDARPAYEARAENIAETLEEFRLAHAEGRAPNPPKREITQGPDNVPVLKRHAATGNIYFAKS